MRGLSTCRALTAVALSLGFVAVPVTAHGRVGVTAGPEGDATPDKPAKGEDARSLYEAGERAYRRGRFTEALEKFEKAYDLSEQPLLLYNIALAYRQLYDVADDVEELRRGRAVLKNFMLFADRDPDLDATDAGKLLKEIEDLIAKHEEENPTAVITTPQVGPETGTTPGSDDGPRTPPGKDPGRVLRIAGGATMGAGGAMVVAGTVAGIVYALAGQNFSDDLQKLSAETEGACDEDSESTECRQNAADIETSRDNGRRANLGVGVSFGLGGGLGLITLATGVVLFLQGNKRSKEWKAQSADRRVRVWPRFTGRGFGIAGRF